jgi:hypothetical protein
MMFIRSLSLATGERGGVVVRRVEVVQDRRIVDIQI